LHFHPSTVLHYQRAQTSETSSQNSHRQCPPHSAGHCGSKKPACVSDHASEGDESAKQQRCLEWVKSTQGFYFNDQNLHNENIRHDSVGSAGLHSLFCAASDSWNSSKPNPEQTFVESWTSNHNIQGQVCQVNLSHVPGLSQAAWTDNKERSCNLTTTIQPVQIQKLE
jgi:hypothetical protein